ncbi:hypothetical protein PsorP6_015763 [Peronosclerospora sorghi]|uniref:Uncharacterized protein n=1 Tax=Peronosclerospora sorghi TaxID=230839 RepID=A0ACC0WQU9_9STRA|nr:hypothetical protein PsorP6_015763 [Peronosclerospora sorghi]
MVDPKTALAIDAAPIAPYDDGDSTESEDLLDQDDTNVCESLVSHAVSKLVQKSAVVPPKTTARSHSVVQRALQLDEEAVIRSFRDVTSSKNDAVASMKDEKGGARKAGETSDAEYCKTCKGYLMPLVERTQLMHMAMLQHARDGALASRECGCCHILYPLVALTDESKSLSCSVPRCYMCHWTTQAAKKQNANGKDRNGMNESTLEMSKPEDRGDDEWCRRCKGKLPPLAARLEAMKAVVLEYKRQGQIGLPRSRQCKCCFITYPFRSLTVESRRVMCTTPKCYTCSPSAADEKMPIVNKHEANAKIAKKERKRARQGGDPHQCGTKRRSDDYDGDLMETEVCRCCLGTLVPLVKRLHRMKAAEKEHTGPGAPPSRQCACCRITYPLASMTAKSRNPNRTVPICLSCCKAGGAAIYEMLSVSTEFFQAYKAENPETAKQLVKKKNNGTLARLVELQRERMRARKSLPSPRCKSKETKKRKKALKYAATHLKARDAGKSARTRRLEGCTKKYR